MATMLRALGCFAVAALCGCGGIAYFDHGGEGGGAGEMVTAASVTAGVASGGMGGGGEGGEPPGGAPPIPPLVELDLGDAPIGEPIPFEIPDAALGLTAYSWLGGPKTSIGFEQVRAPNDAVLVDGYVIDGTLAEFRREGMVTVAMPVTDDAEAMPLMAGSWGFQLGGRIASAPLSLWYRQTLDGAFHGGLVDVNFFVAPGVATESYLTSLADAALGGFAGLSLGTLRFFALDPSYSVVDIGNFFDLMREGEGAPGKPALDVMVVDFIDTPSMPLGFSPGAPANPLVHGTYQSALVMTVSGDLNLDRVVLRHETGHFAGLLHTSEIAGSFGDALGDTPYCPDVPGLLGACPDATNLMFPYVDPSSPMLLTPEQTTVVQASVLYRAAVEPGGGYAEPLDGSGGSAAHGGGDRRMDRERDASRVHRHGLPAQVAQLLSAHWCGGAPWQLLASLHPSPEALVALAADAEAPAYQRARAARLASMMSPAIADELAALAADATIPRALAAVLVP